MEIIFINDAYENGEMGGWTTIATNATGVSYYVYSASEIPYTIFKVKITISTGNAMVDTYASFSNTATSLSTSAGIKITSDVLNTKPVTLYFFYNGGRTTAYMTSFSSGQLLAYQNNNTYSYYGIWVNAGLNTIKYSIYGM